MTLPVAAEMPVQVRRTLRRSALIGGAAAGAAIGGYLGLVTGAIPVDLGVGRRVLRLGPFAVDIAAPREVVFDVLREPYLGRQTRAVAEKIRVLERGNDMVLAAHRTPVRSGLVATTVGSDRLTGPHLDGLIQPHPGGVPQVVTV